MVWVLSGKARISKALAGGGKSGSSSASLRLKAAAVKAWRTPQGAGLMLAALRGVPQFIVFG